MMTLSMHFTTLPLLSPAWRTLEHCTQPRLEMQARLLFFDVQAGEGTTLLRQKLLIIMQASRQEGSRDVSQSACIEENRLRLRKW